MKTKIESREEIKEDLQVCLMISKSENKLFVSMKYKPENKITLGDKKYLKTTCDVVYILNTYHMGKLVAKKFETY